VSGYVVVGETVVGGVLVEVLDEVDELDVVVVVVEEDEVVTSVVVVEVVASMIWRANTFIWERKKEVRVLYPVTVR
jgi:hypothetical protein